MPAVPQIGAGQQPTTQGTTIYFAIGNTPLTNNNIAIATESQLQTIYRTAGTLTNLHVRVSTNGVAGSSTIITRKGGVSQNLTVSIPGNTTGEFEDTTNSDTVTAGDVWNLMMTVGATGTGPLVPLMSTMFNAASPTQKHQYNGTLTNTVGLNVFTEIGGATTPTSGAETSNQYRVRLAGTWKNMAVLVITAPAGATTVRNRINAANGSMVISVPAATTGRFEDTTNSDTLTAGMLINYLRF